jgi:hypothetical protein
MKKKQSLELQFVAKEKLSPYENDTEPANNLRRHPTYATE